VDDQGSSSRSTSLSLIPSSVLNQALVYRTSQANIVDGGMAGTINVTTRKVLNTTTMKGITDASLAGSGYKASGLNGVLTRHAQQTQGGASAPFFFVRDPRVLTRPCAQCASTNGGGGHSSL
jgi:hypothetical protein